MFTISFFVNAIFLGIGLAMDAFSVSLANGLNEPKMKNSKMFFIALVFAFFQTAMPLIGWLCVHTLVEKFKTFEKFIPWIALVLLCYIGGKMLFEGIKGNNSEDTASTLKLKELMIQGIATSIDALSVGFTIADFSFLLAFVDTLLIGVVTFVLCVCGVLIGKKFGTKLSGKASVLGGIILIAIGLEIFIGGVL